MGRGALAMAGTLLVGACGGGDGGTGTTPTVARVFILRSAQAADSVLNVDALGPLQFSALVLDAQNREMTPGTYTLTWSVSDPTVASVDNAGAVDVAKNGTILLVASADGIKDTVKLVILQTATRARVEQDTVVAFTPGATALDGSAAVDTVRFTAARTDANGNKMSAAAAITETAIDDSLFGIVPNAGGDTVKIAGKKAGNGRILIQFGTFKDTVRVQVVSSYKTVGFSVSPAGITVIPASVTISAGTAILFRNNELSVYQMLGTGWRAGPVPPQSREGQVFATAGTWSFTIGASPGTIVVTP
jgi:hypothetical protein